MSPSAGYNINPALSGAAAAASGVSLGLPFNNSGSGIFFGTTDFGAISQTADPSLTQTPSATASASAAGGNNGGAAANAPLLGGGGTSIFSNPIVLIVLVVAGGYLIYKTVKKKPN